MSNPNVVKRNTANIARSPWTIAGGAVGAAALLAACSGGASTNPNTAASAAASSPAAAASTAPRGSATPIETMPPTVTPSERMSSPVAGQVLSNVAAFKLAVHELGLLSRECAGMKPSDVTRTVFGGSMPGEVTQEFYIGQDKAKCQTFNGPGHPESQPLDVSVTYDTGAANELEGYQQDGGVVQVDLTQLNSGTVGAIVQLLPNTPGNMSPNDLTAFNAIIDGLQSGLHAASAQPKVA